MKEDKGVEEDEEFSSRHGVFSFGHVEFGENSQIPMPGRQWKNQFATSEREIRTLRRILIIIKRTCLYFWAAEL